ncbi:MAG: mycothiol system anti-sigma-R factor [Actinomycetota bacterium]|jgi:mycothiol system anti-sigma-R factor|nr:mycothiol system anti-sigma-R factor [Actinomycetota bacterium]
MGDLNCNEALAELYTFLDGELDDARRSDIDEHLGRCGHCHGVHDFEAELRRVIGSRTAEEVPADLRDRILARIRSESPTID